MTNALKRLSTLGIGSGENEARERWTQLIMPEAP